MEVNRSELRRLQKAVESKNKIDMALWLQAFEQQVKNELDIQYKRKFEEDLIDFLDIFFIAIAYTLVFSEETNLNKDTLPEFIDDLYSTVGLFTKGEYHPEEYQKILEENNVFFDDYKYRAIYRLKPIDEKDKESKDTE